MEFDLTGEHADLSYKLLATLITPRPIAWVTTISESGEVNAAPFSFFNVLGTDPPIVGFAPGDRAPGVPKDTAANIRATGEFVVNMVDESTAEAMSVCARDQARGVNELEEAGLTWTESATVKPPRITESLVSLECEEWGTLQIKGNRLVIGLVHRLQVRDGVLDEEKLYLNQEAYPVVGRMHGADGYCRTRDYFRIPR